MNFHRQNSKGRQELDNLDRKLRTMRSSGGKNTKAYKVLEAKRSEVFEAVEGYPEGHVF
jgi:hypothetical protein